MVLASSTPGTLKDTADNQIAPDVDCGHVRPALTDFLGRGETEIPESAAHHIFEEHTPFQGERRHIKIQTKQTKSSLHFHGAKLEFSAT